MQPKDIRQIHTPTLVHIWLLLKEHHISNLNKIIFIKYYDSFEKRLCSACKRKTNINYDFQWLPHVPNDQNNNNKKTHSQLGLSLYVTLVMISMHIFSRGHAQNRINHSKLLLFDGWTQSKQTDMVFFQSFFVKACMNPQRWIAFSSSKVRVANSKRSESVTYHII